MDRKHPDPEWLSLCHAESFRNSNTRAWDAHEFSALLQNDSILCVWEEKGFAIARIASVEAELLTLCTLPKFRRQGAARKLLNMLLERITAHQVEELFLDVAASNYAAINLYSTEKFEEISRRPKYYLHENGQREDAIIMKRDLKMHSGF